MGDVREFRTVSGARIITETTGSELLLTIALDGRDDARRVTAALAPTEVEELSDGYHTFGELYRFRRDYHAAFVNVLARHADDTRFGDRQPTVKSWRHSDGELCFGGGWFIVVTQLPTGQISNHYPADDWDLFAVPEVDLPPEFDGHTAEDVMVRLEDYLQHQARVRS